MQRRHLSRVRANYKLNGMPIDDRQLVCGDVYHHLRRAERAGKQFGAVILDPPPRLPRRRGKKPLGQDLARLARLATSVIKPGGWLLCFFHRTRTTFRCSKICDNVLQPQRLQFMLTARNGHDARAARG